MESGDGTFSRVAIIGLGLIGGSWALALKRRGCAESIVVCDGREVLDRALQIGAGDEVEPDLATAVRGADLVILSAPVGVILEQLSTVRSAAAPNVLVTDTGSTKRAILERAREVFDHEALFLGGHPLAGKEQSGVENADPDLFKGTRYVLTPAHDGDLDDPRARAFQGLLRRIGAEPVVINAEDHDRALAFLSHLPQLLSTALAAMADELRPSLPLGLAAGGFRDMTRLADSPYAMWRDVGLTNSDNLRSAIDALMNKLDRMKAHLQDEDLAAEFEAAKRLRERWRNLK